MTSALTDAPRSAVAAPRIPTNCRRLNCMLSLSLQDFCNPVKSPENCGQVVPARMSDCADINLKPLRDRDRREQRDREGNCARLSQQGRHSLVVSRDLAQAEAAAAEIRASIGGGGIASAAAADVSSP